MPQSLRSHSSVNKKGREVVIPPLLLMEPFTLSVPLAIPVSKKRQFRLNLNNYRNAHHMTLSKSKVEYAKAIAPLLKDCPKMPLGCSLTYTLFPPTQRVIDISNVCSIVDKYLSDTLTEQGIIPDDNYHFITEINYRFGGIDKENPRVEVIIVPKI